MKRLLPTLILLLTGCPKKEDDEEVDTSPAPACDAVTFAAEGLDWSLPNFEGENWRDGVPFSEATGVSYRDCAAGEDLALHYHFADYTNDAVPDLVVTYDGCASSGLGRTHWDVYGGTASGFLSTAVAWSLPEFEGTGWSGDAPLSLTGGQTYRSCGASSESLLNFEVRDMNADAVPDLVISLDQCAGSNVGSNVWEVYLGAGSGFAADPIQWSLPTLNGDAWTGVAVPFYGMEGATWRDCEGDHYADMYHTTADLSGDGIPDLVVTYDTCANPDLSYLYWWVYPGGEDGFAADHEEFALPARDGEDWFEDGAITKLDGEGVRTCGAETGLSMVYTTTDMDGDGILDFTIVDDDCDTTGLGDTHWDVYLSDGQGFAEAATTWTLPAMEGEDWNRGTPFAAVSDRDARTCGGVEDLVMRYQMADLTGDGAQDMVVTVDECADPDVGVKYWWVYPGTGAGFATTALSWALPYPDGIGWSKDVPYPEMVESSYRDCGANDEADFNFSTFVISGDANPDLVVTADACAGEAIGSTAWKVYPGVCADG